MGVAGDRTVRGGSRLLSAYEQEAEIKLGILSKRRASKADIEVWMKRRVAMFRLLKAPKTQRALDRRLHDGTPSSPLRCTATIMSRLGSQTHLLRIVLPAVSL